jgi:hypothetical protein
MFEKIIDNMVANRYQKGKSDMESWIIRLRQSYGGTGWSNGKEIRWRS